MPDDPGTIEKNGGEARGQEEGGGGGGQPAWPPLAAQPGRTQGRRAPAAIKRLASPALQPPPVSSPRARCGQVRVRPAQPHGQAQHMPARVSTARSTRHPGMRSRSPITGGAGRTGGGMFKLPCAVPHPAHGHSMPWAVPHPRQLVCTVNISTVAAPFFCPGPLVLVTCWGACSACPPG